MKPASAWSVALIGIQGAMVEVEAAIGGGLPNTVLVGLPDAALHEARDRCKAAVASSGMQWPGQLVTINLSPATLPKAGSHYDLAIASAVLAAAGVVPSERLADLVLMGEMGLDGRIRPVRGLLPALLAAVDNGCRQAVVPHTQVREAELVEGLTVWGVSHLLDVVEVLFGRPAMPPAVPEQQSAQEPGTTRDLADVVGQVEAKWALEVAAAGRHHLFLHGPPGVGKTLLAECLPGLLPDLDLSEAREVSAIHSLAGVTLDRGLIRRPPYADPHHSASLASLVGGGARVAVPGSVSKAHRGVLFLDEAPEFSSRVLEALRVPLESGRIVLGRAMAQTTYPASFQLIMAANPCPCGLSGVPGTDCRCPSMAVRRYAERVSGPVLDRIDIHQQLRPMRKAYLRAAAAAPAESSGAVAARVLAARERQRVRYRGTPWRTNGEIPGPVLRRSFPLPDGVELVEEAVAKGQLSSRGVDKVLRICWSITDLCGRARPGRDQVRMALAMRRGQEASTRG